MGKELLLSLLTINLLCFHATFGYCQQLDDRLVGKYIVPNNVKHSVVSENMFFEDYWIEFYPNHKFKYYNMINTFYGPSQTQGVWTLHNDTITLESGSKEISLESIGNLEYPFNKYTFKVLELLKGCDNWFEKCNPMSTFKFLTVNNDTITCHPDKKGYITFDKSKSIVCFWAESYNDVTEKIYMPSDKEVNFFIIKYFRHRQFTKEKWILEESGSIIPIDRITNKLANFKLLKDNNWDQNTIWTDAWTPTLNMYKREVRGH